MFRKFKGRSKNKNSDSGLAKVLQQLDQHTADSAKEDLLTHEKLKKTILSRKKGDKTEAEQAIKEAEVDGAVLNRIIQVIQEAMHEEDDSTDRRWSKRLQWPSQKYLRSSWIRIQEQLQPDSPYFRNGEAKILSANAGDIACLGPCLLQTAEPVRTLILHGEMEYCTLLGHLLHIDLAVYFAALRTFAHFLKGNTQLRELVFAFTTCPQVVTDKDQVPVSRSFATEVLPAFEQVLSGNSCLRHVSFRVTHKQTQNVNLQRLCSTSFEASCQLRTAVLCATHPRSPEASPLIRNMPNDILKRILDTAFPFPGPPRVDFEFSHITSTENRTRFVLMRFGNRQNSLHG